MLQNLRRWLWSLLIFFLAMMEGNTNLKVLAQITPDDSLGDESSVVVPNTNIKGLPSTLIDGGATRGGNLFHSFLEFNIDAGRGAYFTNPAAIQNIFSRVTGSNPSEILGTLGVLGDANLFLINPNGIIFGRNASLDLRGSFVGSTANSFTFPDGSKFSATNPSAPPLLTINVDVPVGLVFERESGAIINAGDLEAGQNVTLTGGTVAVTGEISGEEIGIVAITGNQEVQLGESGELLSVSPASDLGTSSSTRLSLAELIKTTNADTGLTVTDNGQVQLADSEIEIPANIGTTIVSGKLDTSNLNSGETGGKVKVLGDNVALVDEGSIDVSGDGGGGTVFIGGNFQGEGSLLNAARLFAGENVTINADAFSNGNGGGIQVESGSHLNLSNSTISGNLANFGGGISNLGTLNLSNSNISDNLANFGGGLDNRGEVSIRYSNISGNSANFGSGINNFSTGTVNLSNSNLSGNSALNLGGGISNLGTLSLSNSTISSNSAANSGGGIFNYNGTLSLSNSTISSNSAANSGGGIFNYNGTATISHSTIFGNYSTNSGGGIDNRGGGEVTISHSTIFGNYSTNSGGGIDNRGGGEVTISYSTISDNSANFGGGILNSGTLTLTNSNLSGNFADSGGGIFNDSGTANISYSNISDNSANFGGGINNSGTLTSTNSIISGNSAGSGGGILNDGVVTLSNNTISNNSTSRSGGGINNSGTLTLTNSTISGNFAGSGGGIFNRVESTLTLTNSTISDNSAGSGGGILNDGTLTLTNNTISGNSTSSFGGGILNDGTLTLTNSTISDNSASFGGGININNDRIVTLINSTISGNSASSFGGGININNSGIVTLTNSTISDNSANFGGGININNSGIVTLTNSTISDNSANFGGGINNSGTVTLTNSTISDNSANFGGGINNSTFDTLTLTNSTISGNSSSSLGGGINNSGTVTLTNSTISDNSANFGGGINNFTSGTLTLTNSIISGNSSSRFGGGINNSGILTLTNSTFNQNMATDITNTNSGIVELIEEHNFDNFIAEGGTFKTTGGNTVSITADSFALSSSQLIAEDNLTFNTNQINFQDLFINTSDLTNTIFNFTATEKININNSILRTEGNNITFNLDTLSFNLTDTDISSSNSETGQSGQLTFTNSGNIFLDNSRLFTTSEPGTNILGGDINIQADALNLVNFSLIDTSTFSAGNAGNIDVTANSLSLIDSSIIRSLTTNEGNAGNIFLNIKKAVSLENLSIISTAATATSLGDSSDIVIGSITSPALSLTLTNGSQLQAVTQGNGKAGNIIVNVTEEITISGVGQDSGSVANPLELTNLNPTDTTLIRETSSPNDTLATAQLLTNDNFTLNIPNAENSDVEFPTRIPYTSLLGTGENADDIDIYQFEANAGTRIVFDIDDTGSIDIFYTDEQDNGQSITSPQIDIQLTLLDNNGNILTANDNTSGLFGREGSDPTLGLNLDPYLRYTITESGTFYLKVERVDGAGVNIIDRDENNPVQTELSSLVDIPYTLNISVEPPPIEGIGSLNGVTPSGIFTNTTVTSGTQKIITTTTTTTIIDIYRGKSIPDFGTVTFNFTIPSLEGAISNLDVRFSAEHSRDFDLDVFLTSPQGTNLELFTDVGSFGENIENFQDTLLDDEATTNIAFASAPFNGAFQPEGTGGLAVFNGENPQGNWILTITDDDSDGNGTLFKAGDEAPWGEAIGTQLVLTTVSPEITEVPFVGGDAGDITINASTLTIESGGEISARTSGNGAGGTININAPTLVDLGVGVQDFAPIITVEASGEGKPGDINLTTDKFILSETARITATATETATNLEGGGSITLISSDMDLAGTVGIFAETEGITPAGTLTLQAENNQQSLNINFAQSAEISASTSGSGEGGSIFVLAPETIKIQGDGKISVETIAEGNAGDITIATQNLTIADGVQISASTTGEGDAGDIKLEASDSVLMSDSSASSAVNKTGEGEAGIVQVTAADITLNNSQLSSSTAGEGDAKDVIVAATDKLEVNNTTISSATEQDAVGNAGSVSLSGEEINISDNSELSTSTAGVGDAGAVTLEAEETIAIEQSTISSAVETGGIGNAGNVNLTASNITITNNSQISSSTSGEGIAGNINVTADTFEATEGSQLRTTTSTSFNAGNITFKIIDNLTLTEEDTGLFANTEEGSTGKGGTIIIDPITVNIFDGATIAVNSQGEGIGGDIELIANTLTLNQGKISAETQSNTGGNITLTLQDLLRLIDTSQISTTAGNEEFGGNGGNINITVPFIIAVPTENSNITANAFLGNGGRVEISAQALFGIEFRPNLTPLSDITASSTFGLQGDVNINTPGIDPTRGLQQLPQEDVQTEINQGCQGRGGGNASFYYVGLGGSPLSPDDMFIADTVIGEWIDLKNESENVLNPTDKDIIDIYSKPILNSRFLFSCQTK